MNKELRASYEVLRNIYSKNAFSSIELNKVLTKSNVNNALVTKIVYGVIENDILLNYFLQNFYKKKPKLNVLVILKMGVFVNKFLTSIPPFALVNELVNLSKTIDKSLSGFVNATLKNIIKTEITYPKKEKNLVEYLSVKFSYPTWLVKMLLSQHSETFVEELLSYKLTTLTHVRINPNATNKTNFENDLQKNGIFFELSKLNGGYFVNYEQLLAVEALKEHYIVMGESSMNLCDIINPQNNKTLLDTCASPGGKSLYLSHLNNTLQITSADIHEHRVQLMKSLVSKYNAKNINVITQDATKLNQDFVNSFNYVLCDVPCSGIGVVNKKPDILLNRKEQDIANLQQLQLQILQTSANYVKVGGELFYSTCTILKQENQDVIYKFLKDNNSFELRQIKQVNNIPAIEENNMLTYFPSVSNTEGFFIAKLVKIH